ncbi:MAG: SDR family NAD(P)-dependent oxidoreductase, partial [Saprospiraceae bacterium]|nr:SDR family NAD(P)-dependent oxidoreductase [Saprospiraceae bacterium]
ALEIDPKFEQAYYALAVCQLQLGMTEAAKANYLQAYLLDEDFRSAEEDIRFGVIRLEDLDESNTEPNEYIEIEIDDNPNKDTVVLVTGATSGIGRSLAERLAIDGYKVIITGRRENRLAIFKKYLEDRHDDVQIETLAFDVRDEAASKAAFNSLPEAWKNIDVLINNAGLAKGFAPFQDGDMQAWEQMIDTNIKGLLYMSRMISPIMVARKKGHIVNVSSVAATQVYPNGNVYCATKAAVDSLTKTMRIDLHSHNIRVSSVSPGHVETEFALVRFDDKEKAKIYEDYQPLKAEDVADAIYYMISRPSHVNIQDMLLFGTQQASVYHIHRNGRTQEEKEEEKTLVETEQ